MLVDARTLPPPHAAQLPPGFQQKQHSQSRARRAGADKGLAVQQHPAAFRLIAGLHQTLVAAFPRGT